MTARRSSASPHFDFFMLESALEALHKTTNIQGRALFACEQHARDDGANVAVDIDINDKTYRYTVVSKRVDRFAALGQALELLRRQPQPALLLAPRITARMANKCQELGIQFIDTQGNASLYGPNYVIFATGQHDHKGHDAFGVPVETAQGGTAAGLKVMFALLCHPKLVKAPYRQIAESAGVALGTVGRTLTDLTERGILAGKKRGDRHILNRTRLLEEWAVHYPVKLRPKLLAGRFTAQSPDWWREIEVSDYSALWGGEPAAAKMTGYLKPAMITLYMQPDALRQNLMKLVTTGKLRADQAGEIEVLETFWGRPLEDEKTDLVPAVLVYTDLQATSDPRNHETAHMIRERELDVANA